MLSTAKKESIERLRRSLPEQRSDERTTLDEARIESGWFPVDRMLRGGLAPGEMAIVEAQVGSGALALTSAWARSASRKGEAVAVIDARSSSSPLAWIEPRDARAPIWVVRPSSPKEAWPALDIAVRSGSFGLVLLLAATRGPTGSGARLRRLCRALGVRLVMSGSGDQGAMGLGSCMRVHLDLAALRWRDSPVGEAPEERVLNVRCSANGSMTSAEVRLCDVETDRLRLVARAADRRPPSSRGGQAKEQAGRSGRKGSSGKGS